VAGEFRIGSHFGYFDPEPNAGSPLLLNGVRGSEAFGIVGARIGLELDGTDDDPIPSRGWKAEVDLGAYPPLAGLDGMFGTATARGSFYVPFSYAPGIQPNLALRFGGSLATGDYPAQFAPFVGGRSSLRGYSYRRFAGDAGANGSAELRIPLGEVNFLVRSKVGVFGLADAGRVWFDGASDGGWHTAFGGGVWAAAFGQAFSLAYAKGEAQRVYVKSGLFF
jgi:outer membrane protein assembly factor BamA